MELWRLTGGCHWSHIPTASLLLLPTGMKGGQREASLQGVKGKKHLLFLASVSQLPRHRLFPVSVVEEALVIAFGNFSPPRRSTRITFISQRCIWVQTGLRVAWGGYILLP